MNIKKYLIIKEAVGKSVQIIISTSFQLWFFIYWNKSSTEKDDTSTLF